MFWNLGIGLDIGLGLVIGLVIGLGLSFKTSRDPSEKIEKLMQLKPEKGGEKP